MIPESDASRFVEPTPFGTTPQAAGETGVGRRRQQLLSPTWAMLRGYCNTPDSGSHFKNFVDPLRISNVPRKTDIWEVCAN